MDKIQRDVTLQKLAQTPLALSMLATAYESEAGRIDDVINLHNGSEEIVEKVVKDYMTSCYEAETNKMDAYTDKLTEFSLDELEDILGQLAATSHEIEREAYGDWNNDIDVDELAKVLGEGATNFCDIVQSMHILVPAHETVSGSTKLLLTNSLLRTYFAFRYGSTHINDPDTRARAVRALGRSRDKRSVSSLLSILSDTQRIVRIDSAKALGEIADSAAIEPLIQKLRQDIQVETGVSQAELFATVSALTMIGGKRCVDALIQLIFPLPTKQMPTKQIGLSRVRGWKKRTERQERHNGRGGLGDH